MRQVKWLQISPLGNEHSVKKHHQLHYNIILNIADQDAEGCLKAKYWGKTNLALDIGLGAQEYLQAMDYGGHSC